MTTDITNVQIAYMMSIRLLTEGSDHGAAFMGHDTLMINVKIALLFLIVIPLLGGTLIFIAKKAHPHFVKVFDEYDVLNNSVQENVNASRVVKALSEKILRSVNSMGFPNTCMIFLQKPGKDCFMERSGDAVYYVYSSSSAGCNRRKEHCSGKYGNRRAYQCDRVCAPDSDVIVHGNLCCLL